MGTNRGPDRTEIPWWQIELLKSFPFLWTWLIYREFAQRNSDLRWRVYEIAFSCQLRYVMKTIYMYAIAGEYPVNFNDRWILAKCTN